MSAQIEDLGPGSADFRLTWRAIATAILAIIIKSLLAVPALFLIKLYTTGAMHVLNGAMLPLTAHNLANIVFLLMVPNLVAGFGCAYIGFRTAAQVCHPTDWRMPALLASTIFIALALVSFLSAHVNHVLAAAELPGAILGLMTLGAHRGTDRAWRIIEAMLMAVVLLTVVAHLLIPRFMMQQYFDPASGAIMEPMKRDPRLPTFHHVANPLPAR